MGTPELNSGIQDLLDGTLPKEARAELFEALDQSTEARALYLDFVHLQLVLDASVQAPPSISENVIPMDRILARQKRKALRIAAFSAAAAIVLAGLISLFVQLPDAPVARFKVSPQTQFMLTHRAVEGEGPPQGKVLEVGSRLELLEGTLELTFASGVRGIVQAPAEISMAHDDRLNLRHGSAWFEVPPGAAGFQVDTADFLVTDLGTEFGVLSDEGEPAEVHVFRGSVEITDHRTDSEAFTLAAYEARRAIDKGGWEPIEADPPAFLTYLPSSPQETLPPHLHWSFDDDGEPLAVAGTHRVATRTETSYSPAGIQLDTVPGRVGDALRLDGSKGFARTNWYGIGGDKARTVAFWLKLPSTRFLPKGSPLVVWGWNRLDPGSTNSKWEILAHRGEGAGRDNNTYLRLHISRPIFISATPIADGEWHHIAVVYNGKLDALGRPLVRFYIDGTRDAASYRHYYIQDPRKAGPQPVDTATDPASADPVTFGGTIRPHFGDQNQFKGEIDELYIFDGVLPEREIRKLANP